MYETSVRSTTANSGKTVLALVAILSLLLSLFAIARPVVATEPGGGDADCPAGTVFLDNFNSGELEVGLELAPGVTITAVTTDDEGEPTSVTVSNTSDENITIAVKGGSDPVGNSVTIAPDGSATISVTTNPTISNLSVCEGPELPKTPTLTVAKITDGGDDDFQFTLDGTNAALLSNGESEEIATAAGEYDIAEVLSEAQATAGWSVTAIDCLGNEAAETANVAEGTVTVTVGDDEDVTCTFTNTLPEQPQDGELEVDKFNCTGEDDDTVFFVFGPFSIQTEQPDTSECTIGAGVTFSVYTDAGAGVPGDFVLEETTDAEGIIEVPLPAGDYVLVEGAEGEEGPSQAFTIESGAITAIVVLNVEGDDDEGEVKILKFVCPGEEDAVVFHEEGDPTIPNLTECEVGEATFTIDDGEEFTTVNGGALKTVAADVEHTLTEVLPNQGSTTFTVGDGDRVTIIVINFEGEDEGSVTINKELEECEACEAFTPGFWFNRGGGGGVDWANTWLMANPQIIDGVGTFDSVGSVQAYLDNDRDGGDGEMGLSATGQLLRHYLALVLNVAFSTENDCDLGSLEFEGMTIDEWLTAALTALETNASDEEKREIKDALDAINNSDAGDGTLECGDTEGGAHAGVMFELYDSEDMLVDSGTTGEDGSLVLDGNPDGTGLPLGTYTLVETTNDADLECVIASVEGEGATLNDDGTVTIVLTENVPHVTITIVNDCEEQPGEEDEFGHISVIKETDEETPTEEFTFEATWDQDGFTLMDGDLEPSGDLLAGEDYTVTEELSEAQIEAGWSLDDITCEGAAAWDVSDDGMSVTITLGADEDVVCTFTNELEDEEEEEGELELIKFFCPTVGDDVIFVFGPLIEEPVEFGIQGVEEEEELPSTEGCTLGAPSEEALGATFTITGGDLEDPLVVITEWDEILTLDLAPGDYTIVEEGTGLTADFTIADEADTAVVVFNFEEEEEAEEGRLKILKIYCVGEGDPVFTVVDGDATVGNDNLPDNCESPEPGDATFTLTMGELTSGEFTLGDDGARLIPLEVGTYVLNEVDPNEASSGEFDITADETTTAIVFNFVAEGEEGGEGGPGQGQTPRENTAGGNPLPNTATSPIPTGSVPAALLALLMLAGLGAAGYAVRAEAQRRR